MDYFSIVDPTTLERASLVRVLAEILLLVVIGIAAGVALRLLPSYFIEKAEEKRMARAAAVAVAARGETKGASTPEPASVVPKATGGIPAQGKGSPVAPPSSQQQQQQQQQASNDELERALDDFFSTEDLLDEALRDASSTAVDSTHEAAPAAAAIAPSPAPSSTNAKAKSENGKKAEEDAELMRRMMKGYRAREQVGKTTATTAAPQSTTTTTEKKAAAVPKSVKQEEDVLETALDEITTTEEILDEALLDVVTQS